MADTAIAITAGSGTNVDTRTESTNNNHRQVVVIGDPATNAGVAPVDVTNGLSVNVTNASLPVATHAVTQSGTWTVQPGNTANTTAWKVDASSVAVPVTDNAGSLTVDNAGTFAVQATQSGTWNSRSQDGSGNALTSATRGSERALSVQIVDGSGAQVTTFGGSGGTSSNVGSATPSAATAAGFSDGTNMQLSRVFDVDSGAGSQYVQGVNLRVSASGGSVEAAAGSGATSASTLRTTLATDSAGIITTGTAGSASSQVVTTQGVASMTPLTTQLAETGNIVSGAITTAMTGTTSTSLIAAPGASLRNYITTIIVSNSHATVGTDVIIQDGSGGTTLMTIPAAAVYGGAVINLPVPLKQPTTNTAIFCANVTTGASTKVSAVGFKAA